LDDGEVMASPVGRFRANAFGLYDMDGNVVEWCSDWYGDYPGGVRVDPSGPSSGVHRVIRGGSRFSPAKDCRSSYRSLALPSHRSYYHGFRVVRSSVK